MFRRIGGTRYINSDVEAKKIKMAPVSKKIKKRTLKALFGESTVYLEGS